MGATASVPSKRPAVIESLGAPPELAREEALMIVGRLSVTIKPAAKPARRRRRFFQPELRSYGLRAYRANCAPGLKLSTRLNAHERLENGLELGHLFFAVERHEFPGDRTRRAAEKRPAIAQAQGQALDDVGLLGGPVGHSK